MSNERNPWGSEADWNYIYKQKKIFDVLLILFVGQYYRHNAFLGSDNWYCDHHYTGTGGWAVCGLCISYCTHIYDYIWDTIRWVIVGNLCIQVEICIQVGSRKSSCSSRKSSRWSLKQFVSTSEILWVKIGNILLSVKFFCAYMKCKGENDRHFSLRKIKRPLIM